jgi:beta-N-acetylhexosaminidase
MRLKISSFVAGVFCLVHGLTALAQSPADTLGKMSRKQKVGQVMIWSFPGSAMTPSLRTTLTKYQPGALIVFRRNIKTPLQSARLNADLQTVARASMPAPLFIMIDQEGGLVTRVRSRTPMPSALALGRMDDVAFVESYGHASADVLKLLGFNVNLAPVMDISNPNKDSFIGNRAFGNDPDTVSEMTMAYARGLNAGGLIPTAKHFPGHGGTMQDSHQTTPRKMSTLDELHNRDFVPFEEFTNAKFIKAVMMAHLSLPNADPSGVPATYSPALIGGQLRDNLGYDGLVITDDLEMNGASVSPDIGERAVRAFLAGNDMLMLAGTQAHQRRAFQAMLNAVASGRISSARLDESVKRVLEAKAGLGAVVKPDRARIAAAFQHLNSLSAQVLKRNFKIAAEQSRHDWPAVDADTRVTVFSASGLFFRKFQKAFNGKARLFTMTPGSLDGVKRELASSRTDFAVFFASGNKTAHWLNTLPADQRGKLLVVNCNHPGEIEAQSEYLAVLNLNSYFTDSGTWLGELLNQPQAEVREPAQAPGEPTGESN